MLCNFLNLLYGGFNFWSSAPCMSMAPLGNRSMKFNLTKRKARELSKGIKSRGPVQEEKGMGERLAS